MKPEIEYLPVTPKSIGDWVYKKGTVWGDTMRTGTVMGTRGEYVKVLWCDKSKTELVHPNELTWY